jgi:hypothetical protein
MLHYVIARIAGLSVPNPFALIFLTLVHLLASVIKTINPLYPLMQSSPPILFDTSKYPKVRIAIKRMHRNLGRASNQAYTFDAIMAIITS